MTIIPIVPKGSVINIDLYHMSTIADHVVKQFITVLLLFKYFLLVPLYN